MKYLVITLLGSALAFNCQRSDQTTVPLSESIVIAMKQSARVGQNLSVQVDSISDSRCPANVTCIRYGNADVLFTLSDGTARQSAKLRLGDCGKGLIQRDSISLQLGTDRYQVLLTDVRPFPSTEPTTPKQAVLSVTKQ